MAYTIGPIGGLGRIPKEQFDPFAHLPENQYYLPPQTGLRTLSTEQFPGGGSFTEVLPQPDAGLERGLAEYRAKGGIKPRSEYEQAYAQALGEIRPSEGNIMPSSYQDAQAEIQRMIKVGRAKGYADNDIIADIRERGLDKIQPVKPEYKEVSKGAGLYQLGPEGVKEIVSRGLEEQKAPTSEFGMFAADYTQRKPGASMEEVVKAFHGAKIPETKPLPTTALTNLRNPETLEPLPYGTTAEEAQTMGAIRVSQKNVDTLKDLDNTDVLINQIDAITKRLMSATSPVEAISGGALKKAGAITRMAPLASAYNDQKSAFLGVISRTMGGERGVLTDRDISRIENSLPGFTDTRQLRDYKISTIKNLMGVAKQAARAKLVGGDVDTSAMRAQIDRQLDELEGIKTQPTDTAAIGGGRIKIVSPDGKVGTIPENQLEKALGQGYKRSQ